MFGGWEGRFERGETGVNYMDSIRYLVGKRPFMTVEGYLGMGPAKLRREMRLWCFVAAGFRLCCGRWSLR